MRHYRDKFVAHLDSDRGMNLPLLDFAKSSVEFYHAYLIENEAQAGELSGLADTAEKMSMGHQHCEEETAEVYEWLQHG